MSAASVNPGDRAPPSAEELRQKSCAELGACSRDTPLVPLDQVKLLMASLPAWRLSENGRSISRAFVAKNFVQAIAFFNRVADVAEAEGHHPDLHLTNYRDVEVVLCTHAINGLAMADFVLAAKLDALPVEFSPKWLKANS